MRCDDDGAGSGGGDSGTQRAALCERATWRGAETLLEKIENNSITKFRVFNVDKNTHPINLYSGQNLLGEHTL